MPLADFNPEQWVGFLLVLMRASALLATLPFLGSANIPGLVKAGLALSLAILISPAVKLPAELLPRDLPHLAYLGLGEVFIGLILGLSVRLLLTAVQIMGQLAGFQMGFAVANVFDPIGGEQVSVLAQFCYLMAMLVFFAVGGHLSFFAALHDSFKAVPPGHWRLTRDLYDQVMSLVTMMFTLSIKIGAPVIGALIFLQVVMGVLAKTVPQMNILVVGFPLTISVGLVFLSLTLTVLVPVLTRLFSGLGPLLNHLLRAM